jgi:hypothetical protein
VVLLKKLNLAVVLFFLISISILSSSAFAAVDFEATSPVASIEAFACEQKAVPITVTNTGDETAEFAVFFDGDAANWVSPIENFMLNAGASQSLELNIDAPCNAFGSYSLGTIIATVEFEKVLDQQIDVSKSINIGLTPVVWKQSVNPCETTMFSVEISNLGTFAEQYFLSASSPFKNTTISKTTVSLAAGENETVSINATPDSCLQYGNYTLTLLAKTNKTALSAELDLSLAISSAGITAITGPDSLKISYSGANATFNIANKGDSKMEYVLGIAQTGANASFAELEAQIVTIKAGENSDVLVLFNPSEETKSGTYDFKLTAITDSGKEYPKEFSVALKKPSQISAKIMSVLIPIGHFFSTIFGFVKHNIKYAGYGLLGIAVLVVLGWLFKKLYKIAGRKRRGEPEKRQKARKSRYMFLTIGIIVALAVLVFGFVNAPKGHTDGIPDQTWQEDLAHKIDLNKYFKDPDGDALEFANTELEHINVEINNGIATLTPEADWFGTETATFVADDGNGGIVESNEVKLTVLSSPDILPRGIDLFFKGYSNYILGGLIVLILVLVYFGLERYVFK